MLTRVEKLPIGFTKDGKRILKDYGKIKTVNGKQINVYITVGY